MNYQWHYNQLMERAVSRNLTGYQERHHVIPRCRGGTDEHSNIVSLTPEEHYVAHQLLIKLYPNDRKLVYAAKMMTIGATQNNRSNKLYGWLRRKFSQTMKETAGMRPPISEETRQKMRIAKLGKKTGPQSEETRSKISAAVAGKSKSDEHRAALSVSAKNRRSTPRSAEARARMSTAQKIACATRDDSYKYTEEYRLAQSQKSKEAWARRKNKQE